MVTITSKIKPPTHQTTRKTKTTVMIKCMRFS